MTDKDIVNVCYATRSIMYYLSNMIQYVEDSMNRRIKDKENQEPREFC